MGGRRERHTANRKGCFVLDYVDAVDDMGKEFDLTPDEEEEASRSIYPEGGAE
jgi:hypothetical protein